MSSLGSAMAGGNPRLGRQKDDFYPTPPDVTHAVVRHLGPEISGVWEPCAGNGAMSAVLLRYGWKVAASDIAPRAPGILPFDFLSCADMPPGCNTIITNPPFNLAEKIIRHAFAIGCTNLALVLKTTFWSAASRRPLFAKHRPSLILPLTWRPDFLNLGAPTMDVMWCVWHGPCAARTDYELLPKPSADLFAEPTP